MTTVLQSKLPESSVPLGRKSPSLSKETMPTKFTSVVPAIVKSFGSAVGTAIEWTKNPMRTDPSDTKTALPRSGAERNGQYVVPAAASSVSMLQPGSVPSVDARMYGLEVSSR
jgi:hypothetical protein